MPRPPTRSLEVRLPCAQGLGGARALGLCLGAAGECGLRVAARASSSLVLLPGVNTSLRRCLLPGLSAPADDAGNGIAVELVTGGSGKLVISVSASEGERDKAYVTALRAKLSELEVQEGTQDETEMGASRFQREASAYLLVSKWLCDGRRAPGIAAAEFVQTFTCKYSEGTSTPTSCRGDSSSPVGGGPKVVVARDGHPLAECAGAVNRLCRILEEDLAEEGPAADAASTAAMTVQQARRAQLAGMKPWLRKSVERCVFGRVGPVLWRFYASQHESQDARYAAKARALGSVSDEVLMDALEIPATFRGNTQTEAAMVAPAVTPHSKDVEDNLSEAGTSNMSTACSSLGADGDECMSPGAHGRRPYGQAAASLAQVQALLGAQGRGGAPREALEALATAQLEMKACALEASGGETELCSMDDILPLFIFVLVRSTLRFPMSCAKFLGDALSRDEQMDGAGRAVLLLESAARYVAEDWDLEELLNSPKV